MNPFQTALLILTYLILGGLLWFGQREDRLGAASFFGVMVASQIFYPLTIGNVRWGVALASVTFLCALISLVVFSRRWWLIAAAGFQVAATASYAIAYFQPDLLIWTGVSFRLVLWILQMAACLFGIAEALSARRQIRSHSRAEARPLSTEYHP